MKTHLLLLLFVVLNAAGYSQVLYDYETAATSKEFIYFGGSNDGQKTVTIDNPDNRGNTSAKVASYVKPAGSEIWAGAYTSQPQPVIEATSDNKICVDVWMNRTGSLSVKLEQSNNGGQNWRSTQSYTDSAAWQTLCFDFDAQSVEDPVGIAAGFTYNQLVLFFNFGEGFAANDQTFYFDNVRIVKEVSAVLIYDFETAATSTDFTYFGSSLDGMKAPIISNPDASGINASPNVCHYTKAANSQTWAGAYANPQPVIDATNGGQICVDVWMDHIGLLAVKLEQSTTTSNWIITVPNTKINTWETLCFDLNENSIENGAVPATGHVFNQIVLFPDFGTAFPTAQEYYIDNIRLLSNGGGEDVDINFAVDMKNVTTPFTKVYVSGNFNSWSGDANPMSDDNNDGVWTTTITLPKGSYEYKFSLDNWANSEQFDIYDVCTVSTDDGNGNVFVNRVLNANKDKDEVFCYGSCYACGESIDITWNLNMNNETVSDQGVYLAGGPFFGHGDFRMTDDNNDGIYSITLNRQKGFATDYTFINGICLPDWTCKENIAGQDCAVAPFNDRNITTADVNVVINTCFGECSVDGTCSGGPATHKVTFNVDMSKETVTGSVWLAGGAINNWTPGVTPMLDPDGDKVYTAEVDLSAGIIEYKFVNNDNWETLEEGPCTITDPSGQFINRLLLLEEKDSVLQTYVFGTCQTPSSSQDIILDIDLFDITPTVSQNNFMLQMLKRIPGEVNVYHLDGRKVLTQTIDNSKTVFIDGSSWPSGLYNVTVVTNQSYSFKKIIKQ